MSEYTPSTEEVRERWMAFDDAGEFDRWLAAHDLEVRSEGWVEGFDANGTWGETVDEHERIRDSVNPYTVEEGS